MAAPEVIQEFTLQDGLPMKWIFTGICVLIVGSVISRAISDDKKFEVTKRHHPKAVGYTGINHQMDVMNENVMNMIPFAPANKFEYSTKRHRKRPGK